MRKKMGYCLAASLLLLLVGCGQSAWEHTDQQAQKYIDKEDYATAESVYLRYIEREPLDESGYYALYSLYHYDMHNKEKAQKSEYPEEEKVKRTFQLYYTGKELQNVEYAITTRYDDE